MHITEVFEIHLNSDLTLEQSRDIIGSPHCIMVIYLKGRAVSNFWILLKLVLMAEYQWSRKEWFKVYLLELFKLEIMTDVRMDSLTLSMYVSTFQVHFTSYCDGFQDSVVICWYKSEQLFAILPLQCRAATLHDPLNSK